jgi:aryl-alcohol dehydrogenase-like predicted oxidoreductase
MEYTNLGRTGLKVSRICLGTMTFGWSATESTSAAIMEHAFENGINFLDTADIYSRWIEGNKGGESEIIIGNWMKHKSRRDLVIATKGRGRMWPGPNGEGLSRAHLMQALEDSLRRLQTDYIDVYQVHHPDYETPLDETLRALDDMVRSGKVRYVGCSNYPAWLLMKSLWISDVQQIVRFDCLQPHHSLLHRAEYERELQAVCADQGIGVIPYSPLAAGFLTGKYSRDSREVDTTRASSGLIQQLTQSDHAYRVLDAVREIALTHQRPLSQIALAWQLANPTITAPIIGARTVAQLDEVLGAEAIRLSQEEIRRLNEVSEGF